MRFSSQQNLIEMRRQTNKTEYATLPPCESISIQMTCQRITTKTISTPNTKSKGTRSNRDTRRYRTEYPKVNDNNKYPKVNDNNNYPKVNDNNNYPKVNGNNKYPIQNPMEQDNYEYPKVYIRTTNISDCANLVNQPPKLP